MNIFKKKKKSNNKVLRKFTKKFNLTIYFDNGDVSRYKEVYSFFIYEDESISSKRIYSSYPFFIGFGFYYSLKNFFTVKKAIFEVSRS